jgi:subtilase family serine protease
MLQFVNSTVFLSKSYTQKKIIHDKKSFNKNLTKSSSFTNSTTNFENKIVKSTLQLENIQKKSIKQKIFAKTQKDQQ